MPSPIQTFTVGSGIAPDQLLPCYWRRQELAGCGRWHALTAGKEFHLSPKAQPLVFIFKLIIDPGRSAVNKRYNLPPAKSKQKAC